MIEVNNEHAELLNASLEEPERTSSRRGLGQEDWSFGRTSQTSTMTPRIVSWNCRRAGEKHAAWAYLTELSPD